MHGEERARRGDPGGPRGASDTPPASRTAPGTAALVDSSSPTRPSSVPRRCSRAPSPPESARAGPRRPVVDNGEQPEAHSTNDAHEEQEQGKGMVRDACDLRPDEWAQRARDRYPPRTRREDTKRARTGNDPTSGDGDGTMTPDRRTNPAPRTSTPSSTMRTTVTGGRQNDGGSAATGPVTPRAAAHAAANRRGSNALFPNTSSRRPSFGLGFFEVGASGRQPSRWRRGRGLRADSIPGDTRR